MHTDHRVFDRNSHEQFARISCDYNPVHMDPAAARRTQSGAQIVHGIHSFLWLLECFCQSDYFSPDVTSLRVQFRQPIYVGDEASLEISGTIGNVVRARVLIGGEEVLVSSFGFNQEPRSDTPMMISSSCITPPESPSDLRLEAMEGMAGCLAFGPASSEIGTMFPSAVRAFGLDRIATLTCSSCLVGMVVPGLHSMFSGLSVSIFEDNAAPSDSIQYAVLSVVKRFRLVRIGISGPGLCGSLETLSRMPPVRQAPMSQVMPLISRDEFRNDTALIVGGSRGLGELTAKLVAAGGARVLITYALGKPDADAVVEELKAAGASCTALTYDVHLPAAKQLQELDTIPTHLYYFATPPIFRRKAGLFDAKRFDEFNSFYVTAFFDLVQTCRRLRADGIRVFYPSSVAVDNRPATMTEYSMSKAAAEILCADLSKFVPGVHVLTHRLPRLPTDQTNSIVLPESNDPIAVMLPIVRQMHQK